MLEKTLSELGDALGDVACFTPAAFERFAQQIPAELVLQALAETGTASLRKRRLPAEQVVTRSSIASSPSSDPRTSSSN